MILSGGPESVTTDTSPRAPHALFEAGTPVFGICYGQQAMAAQLGGEVEGGHHAEFGRAEIEILADSPLFKGIWHVGEKYPVWMSHGDRVTKLPEGFRPLASSSNAPLAVVADEGRQFYGVQFHPEVAHTPQGELLIRNFVREIAGCTGDWTMKAFRQEAIERIRAQVGKGRVICGLSGGVDSAVAAVLIHEAIGEQLTCVFVDHGLMRANEAERGRHAVPRPLQHPARPCAGAGPLHRRARRRLGSGDQAQDHRQALHRRVRSRSEDRSAAPSSWRRARSIRT